MIQTMKKTLLLTVFGLLACVLIFCGCDRDETVFPGKGTKWKLAGLVDTQTGELTEFDPKDCAGCYTLTFDTDHTATAHSILIDVKFDLLKLNPDRPMEAIYHDEGHPHGHDFRIAILVAGSFSLTSDEFKLFNKYKTSYLLFKLIEQ
jgi:hypothetical protein